MRSQAGRLPSRFPVGTRHVIEGRAGRIHSSYIEFPDGRQIELPTGVAKRARARADMRHRTQRREARNI